MRVGDLIQAVAFGAALKAPPEAGIIVGIVKNAHPIRTCFEVLMSGSGDIIRRWSGDLEAINANR